MKGDIVLVPVALQSTDPEELSKLVVAERIKRGQTHAKAYYTATYVPRPNINGGNGYVRYNAFVEFSIEEK